jgi:hypothetical protein
VNQEKTEEKPLDGASAALMLVMFKLV